MVTTYLIGGQQVMFTHGYHTNAFLIDFLQYYGCRPAFARNSIYEDRMSFKQLSVSGNTIWEHLLNHERVYEWRVVRMKVPLDRGDKDSDWLFVSTDEYRHFDELYQVVRVILHDGHNPNKQSHNELRLKFYILLVSTDQHVPFPEMDDILPQVKLNGEFLRLRPEELLGTADEEDEEGDEDTGFVLEKLQRLPSRKSILSLRRRRFCSGGVEERNKVHKRPSLYNEAEMVPFPWTGGRFKLNKIVDDELLEKSSPIRKPRLSFGPSAPRRHRKSATKQSEWAVLAADGAVVLREQVTYVQYVSGRQQKLQTALEDSVTHLKRRLHRTVNDVGWHCKRDRLWKQLLNSGPPVSKSRSRHSTGAFWSSGVGESGGTQSSDSVQTLSGVTGTMTAKEVDTLLGYVHVVCSTEVDSNLAPFLAGLSEESTLSLLRCLLIRYGPDRCRFLIPESGHVGSRKHFVVVNPNFLDSLVLVTMTAKTPGAKLSLVYKDWDILMGDPSEKNRAYKLAIVQTFFEEVVSCLAYIIWQKLLITDK